ncbi:metal-dependent hydrolase [Candidatus Woesearchaeota archaeon]|nr:metal-dependent hydrolase [Candidatus Woesearchaeota archaeon]
MDPIAHSLWAAIAYKLVNLRLAQKPATRPNIKKQNIKPFTLWHAAWWGVFPDILSFGPLFVWRLYELIITGSYITGPVEPAGANLFPIREVTGVLYRSTHSIVVFAAMFLIIWAVRSIWLRRGPPWILCAWAVHILLDIISHSYTRYPTPFLWPLSEYRFPYGTGWQSPAFMAVNYGLMVVIILWLWKIGTARATPVRRR